MIVEEWYEDVPTTKKVLMRRCAASDCDRVFTPRTSRQLYCEPACRFAEFRHRHRDDPMLTAERQSNAS